MVIAVTGHRPHKLGGYSTESWIHLLLFTERILQEKLENKRDTTIITGMAIGWDQAVAAAARRFNIPFIAAIPFEGQEAKWPEHSRGRYYRLLDMAKEKVVVCEGSYAPWKMQKRNEWMVDRADKIIALWDGNPGGTGNAVQYAMTKGIPILNVWNKWTESQRK